MQRLIRISMAALISMSASAWAYQPETKAHNAWSAISAPTNDYPEAIGSYANGCMTGAARLSESGKGFVDMRRNRNRFYGQPELIQFIQQLGEFTHNRHQQNHLIGDLSQPRGGRMNFGHTSHQVGLDADIWMQTIPENQRVNPYRDMKTIIDRESGTVNQGALRVPTRDALYFAATHPNVVRIFVNPVVKMHLCNNEADTSWLRTLRPWWGHDQHFHVRLKCGASQSLCRNQNPPPQGDGCNSSLYNWVDEQSGRATGRIKPKKTGKKKKKRKPKVMPQRCQQMLWN